MKVLLVNGGPHKEGNTNAALMEIARQLSKEGIESEIFWIGNDAISDAAPVLPAASWASVQSTIV